MASRNVRLPLRTASVDVVLSTQVLEHLPGPAEAVAEWRRVLGLPDPESEDSWASDWVVEQIRFALFGRPPKVRLAHHR